MRRAKSEAMTAKVMYEISWQKFERRDKWRQMIPLFNSLGAAQMLKLKREYPEAYAWLQRNA
jgi:hypothetical protein